MMPEITPLFPAPEDEFTQMLRGALHAEASGINPPDRFADLLASLDAEEDQLPRGRRTFRWVAAASVAAIALAVSVPLILQDRVEPAVSAAPSTAVPTTTPASQTPTSTVPLPGALEALPIYYVGRDGLLYREFRSLVGEDSLTTAVNALLNVAPLDPDYASRWAPGTVLAGLLTPQPVGFEIDDLDGETQTGWSVLVRGTSGPGEPGEGEVRGRPGLIHAECALGKCIQLRGGTGGGAVDPEMVASRLEVPSVFGITV